MFVEKLVHAWLNKCISLVFHLGNYSLSYKIVVLLSPGLSPASFVLQRGRSGESGWLSPFSFSYISHCFDRLRTPSLSA